MVKFVPINDCQLKDLKGIKEEKSVVALHETGHLIVMYALDLMDYFSYITIEAEAHKNEVNGKKDKVNGLTEVTEEYKSLLNDYAKELTAGKLTLIQLIRKTKIEGAKLYLPNICRLFGGGAICRFYDVPNEKMCSIDYEHINTLLEGLGITGNQIETIRSLVDMYLNPVFISFESLTKTIYQNLKESKTLDKNQVMQIIREWEEFSFQ